MSVTASTSTEKYKFGERGLVVLHNNGDNIAEWHIDGRSDAILNPTDETMLGLSEPLCEVSRKILGAAGPELIKSCKQIPVFEDHIKCRKGTAILTKGFRLLVGNIIHVVGPTIEDGDNRRELLSNAYRNSFYLAAENGIKYVALVPFYCGLSCEEEAEIGVKAIQDHALSLSEVHILCNMPNVARSWYSSIRKSFDNM